MLEALKLSLAPEAVVAFLLYLLGALVLFYLFKFAYTRITPHKELPRIREGNVAAAVGIKPPWRRYRNCRTVLTHAPWK